MAQLLEALAVEGRGLGPALELLLVLVLVAVGTGSSKAVQDQMTAFGAWTARMLGR